MLRLFFLLILYSPWIAVAAFAESDDLLTDRNGDGKISVLFFGDSITAGLGDGISPGAFIETLQDQRLGPGYPGRVSALSGIESLNRGVPGEEIASGGYLRFPIALSESSADLVAIMEGTNDAIFRLDSGRYRGLLQRMINVARASGKEVLLLTLPKPCCNRAGQGLFVAAYTNVIRDVAALNNIAVADVDQAWRSTCENPFECELYNLPEGLHPNTRGYDVISQVVAASLFEIDIFSQDGARMLESALGLEAGAVIVRPFESAQ